MEGQMTVMCQRCGEYVDGVPDGCRDPACPRAEIEDAIEEQTEELAWHILRGNIDAGKP